MRSIDVLVVGDGNSTHTQRHVGALASSGFRVELAAFEGPDVLGVSRFRLGRGSPQADIRYPLAVPGLARHILSTRPRVVHGHYVSSYGLLAAAAVRLTNRLGRRPSLIQSAWGYDLLVTGHSNRIRRAAAEFALTSADLVTWDSLDLKHEASTLAPKVPSMRFVWGPPQELLDAPIEQKRRIVVARALVSHVRVDLVVRGFKAAKLRDPETMNGWGLDVVGDGPSEPSVVAAAEGDPSIQFHGRLPLPQLRAVLRAASIYANVPESDATSAVLMDSLALGLRPVVNDLPAYREWVDPDIGEVVSRDPTESELADALVRAVSRKVDPERIRDRVRHVAWESQMAGLIGAYANLTIGGTGGTHR